jgi:hypothetical protein
MLAGCLPPCGDPDAGRGRLCKQPRGERLRRRIHEEANVEASALTTMRASSSKRDHRPGPVSQIEHNISARPAAASQEISLLRWLARIGETVDCAGKPGPMLKLAA